VVGNAHARIEFAHLCLLCLARVYHLLVLVRSSRAAQRLCMCTKKPLKRLRNDRVRTRHLDESRC